MARFQTPDGTRYDSICLDTAPNAKGKQKSLSFVYTAADDLVTGSYLDLDVKRGKKTTPFLMTAKPGGQGRTYVLPAGDDDAGLTVQVGRVTNHREMSVDLFAELLGRSESPAKLRAYQKALQPENNNVPDDGNYMGKLSGQPLMQITKPRPANDWNCGAHVQKIGAGLFGRISAGEPTLYYNPKKLKGTSAEQTDVSAALDTAKLKAGVDRIQGLLDRKTVVRVFCSHHYPVKVSGGVVHPSGNTHYLAIVGYGTSEKGNPQFLCIDPWPGGSRLDYTSGIFGTVSSAFMGLIEFSNGVLGSKRYWVLSGP